MAKEFNITGLCFADEHYMADVSKKLAETMEMMEKGKYFIINRPRQYGKTTMLYSLAEILEKTGQYLVFNISFEGIGDAIFHWRRGADTHIPAAGIQGQVFETGAGVDGLNASVICGDEVANVQRFAGGRARFSNRQAHGVARGGNG